MDTSGEWNSEFGNIIAIDYAVIARFRDAKNMDVTSEGCLYDYFLAGIRGLGTWGTTWYIDRKYKQIVTDRKNSDIQILLEVIFRNDRIFDIKDVSEEPPAYFENQNNLRTIKRRINQFRESRHIF